MGRGTRKPAGGYGPGYKRAEKRPKPQPGEKRPVVMSFTPDVAKEILDSEEAIELRRHSGGCEDGTPMVMYTSGKVRKVEGSCVVKELIEGTPEEIWERGAKNMFDKEAYFGYFAGAKKACAFILTDIKRNEPFELPFPGPRSFRYLYEDEDDQRGILEKAGVIQPADSEQKEIASLQ